MVLLHRWFDILHGPVIFGYHDLRYRIVYLASCKLQKVDFSQLTPEVEAPLPLGACELLRYGQSSL